MTNMCNSDCDPFNLTSSCVKDGCSASQFGGMHSVSFWLYQACGRTCKRVEVWPITKASVSTRHQKFLWTPGSMPKQTKWIKAKCWIRFWCEPAGKLSEMLQSCLNFARQELPLCGTCNYQPCAMQEGIMARIRWVPNACFKLYAFKALMKLLWTWLSWQKFRLSTLVLEMIVESLTHACKKWS